MASPQELTAIAQMLADLGNDRREDISAPQADNCGHVLRTDSKAKDVEVARILEKRQQRVDSLADDTAEHRAIKAWNAITMTHSDDPAHQLANLWAGQGHRVAPGQERDADNTFENLVLKYGSEERATYEVQKRQQHRQQYSSSASVRGRPSHGRDRSSLLRRRAASPGAHGTVRYVNDQRIEKHEQAERAPIPTGPRRHLPSSGYQRASAMSRATSRMADMSTALTPSQLLRAQGVVIPCKPAAIPAVKPVVKPAAELAVTPSANPPATPAAEPASSLVAKSAATPAPAPTPAATSATRPAVATAGEAEGAAHSKFRTEQSSTVNRTVIHHATSSHSGRRPFGTEEPTIYNSTLIPAQHIEKDPPRPSQSPVATNTFPNFKIDVSLDHWLSMEDLGAVATPGTTSTEIHDTIMNLFDVCRVKWLSEHKGHLETFRRFGCLLRLEMMFVAQLSQDSARSKHLFKEFGFLPDISTHLSAARNAIALAGNADVEVEAFYRSHSHYQPFYIMAQRVHAQRIAKEGAASKDYTGASSSDSNAGIGDNPSNGIHTGPRAGKDSYDHTYQPPAGTGTTVQQTKDGNAAIVNGNTATHAENSTPRSFVDEHLIELLERNSRLMLARSGMMVDGSARKRGIYHWLEG